MGGWGGGAQTDEGPGYPIIRFDLVPDECIS